jgi:alpha-glucosidase
MGTPTANTAGVWWQEGIIYEIYPRSFQDSNGDGNGDLGGIIARLDHFVELGIDAIWISPIFPSPMRDGGYDVVNYTDIDPLFGTLDDFDRLLSDAHARGIKVLLDLVPNHTSDQHPWFRESRTSVRSPKRDWYLWRDPAPDGGPPNNWLSEFGGSAWEFDVTSGQYYYHAFLPCQPDLNWRNQQLRAAMFEVMRFWLRRGVDGFRVDVLWHLLKDAQFRDNPTNPDFKEGDPPYRRLIPSHTTDLPEVHDVVAALRNVIDEFPDRVMIGEVYLPFDRLVAYYGRELRGAHLPFNFSLIEQRWDATAIANLINSYERALPPGGWPNWVLGNHDRPRIATRIGLNQARIAAMLLLTLRGTPTIYYGEEIGMQQCVIANNRVRDPIGDSIPGLERGRDGVRTPMQWDASQHAGFSSATPWLPVCANSAACNLAEQRGNPRSMYNLYRRLIACRRAASVLRRGGYRKVEARGDVLIFVRQTETERLLVALNFGKRPTRVALPVTDASGTIAVSCFADREGEKIDGAVDLRADEGVVIQLLSAFGDL